MPSFVVHPLRTLRNSHTLGFRQIRTTVDYYKYSLYPLSIVQWNRLPAHIALLPIFDSIKMKIQKVTPEKDLGVTFDQNLKFTDHINNKVNKANKNVGLIFRTFTFMDKDMFLSFYKSVVRPHLEYASSVWSPIFKKDKILIENVQRRATRLVKCLKQ